MTDEDSDAIALRKAKAEADLAEAELAEWKSMSARAAREAERRAAASKSDRDRLPDFSSVERGSLTSPDSGTSFGSVLGMHAMGGAAASVVGEVCEAVSATPRETEQQARSFHFVVTTDGQLATSDGVYLEVVRALDDMLGATRLCPSPETTPGDLGGRAIAGAAAVASVLPAVLSLAASRRSLTTEALSLDTGAAAAAVAARLASVKRCSVWHDDVQVLAPLADSPLQTKLDDLSSERARLTDVGTNEAVALIARIDELWATFTQVPDGATRSLLVTAMLRERLHVADDAEAAAEVWLVWVQGCTGSASQVVDDRPLMFKDKVSTIASLGITYLLVEASTGQVRAGGTRVQTCSLSGSIGSRFELGAVEDTTLRTRTEQQVRQLPDLDARPAEGEKQLAGRGLAVAQSQAPQQPRWVYRLFGRRQPLSGTARTRT